MLLALIVCSVLPTGAAGKEKATDYIKRGDEKRGKGDMAGAIADYSRAIELNPKSFDAYNRRGLAKNKNRDTEGAIADYGRAIAVAPDSFAPYFNRAIAKFDKGDQTGAIADFERALAIEPDDDDAKAGLAAAETMLALKGNTAPSVLKAGDLINSGNTKLDGGNIAGAIADYSQSIQLNPEFAIAYYSRARARQKKGDTKGALNDYSRAIELNPKYAEAYNNRGNIKDAKGDKAGAYEDFNRAIAANPEVPQPYLNRGMARLNKGDRTGAAADLERYLKSNPDNANAKRLLGIASRDTNLEKPGGMRFPEDTVPAFTFVLPKEWKVTPHGKESLILSSANSTSVLTVTVSDSPSEIAEGLDEVCKAIFKLYNSTDFKKEQDDTVFDIPGVVYSGKNTNSKGVVVDMKVSAVLADRTHVAGVSQGTTKAATPADKAALAAVAKSVRLNESPSGGALHSALAKMEKNDVAGALADATRAIEIDPKYVDAHWLRTAIYYSDQKKWDQVMSGSEKLIELVPKNMMGYIFRAGVKVKKQKWDEALADIYKALATNADDTTVFGMRFSSLSDERAGGFLSGCYAIRGIAKAGKGDVDGGLKDLNLAIERMPKHADYYLERGKVRRDKGDMAGALADFERAVELNPKDEEARKLLDAAKQNTPAR